MGWKFDASLKRVQCAYDATADLEVGDVVRETDLESTTLGKPRRITAAHFYVDVVNFRKLLASDPIDDEDTGGGETLLHQSHLWAREVSKVVQDFDATKVHFQGPKLHGLAYRPIGDDRAMVVKAVLTAAAVRATAGVFADVLDLDEVWATAAGVDFGEALVTKDGVRGDRELLFLGNPANRAAKILGKGLRITVEVADLLPEEFANFIAATNDPTVRAISLSDESLEALVETFGFSWTREVSRLRLEQALEKYPAGSASVYSVAAEIDKNLLGMSNTKRVDAISFFADVDGFTAYVTEADRLGQLDEAVRAYHAIRSEMRHVTVADYGALRIQYQGDRIQSAAYLPIDSSEAVVLKAVKAAAAMHSALAEVLPQVVGADAAKPVAIGIAAGPVLISKLGEHGNRDVVSLGVSTADAARIQGRLDGAQTGLDSVAYSRLPAWAQEFFDWRASAGAYVAERLTLDVFERAEDRAKSLRESAAGSAIANQRTGPLLIGSVAPIRPYRCDC